MARGERGELGGHEAGIGIGGKAGLNRLEV